MKQVNLLREGPGLREALENGEFLKAVGLKDVWDMTPEEKELARRISPHEGVTDEQWQQWLCCSGCWDRRTCGPLGKIMKGTVLENA